MPKLKNSYNKIRKDIVEIETDRRIFRLEEGQYFKETDFSYQLWGEEGKLENLPKSRARYVRTK